MRVGQTRKRDANEAEIISALRAVGVLVWPISGPGVPDLLCWHQGRWLAVEVKHQRLRRTLTDRKGRTLTPAQVETHMLTQFPIVATVQEALALFGVKEQG